MSEIYSPTSNFVTQTEVLYGTGPGPRLEVTWQDIHSFILAGREVIQHQLAHHGIAQSTHILEIMDHRSELRPSNVRFSATIRDVLYTFIKGKVVAIHQYPNLKQVGLVIDVHVPTFRDQSLNAPKALEVLQNGVELSRFCGIPYLILFPFDAGTCRTDFESPPIDMISTFGRQTGINFLTNLPKRTTKSRQQTKFPFRIK